MLNVCWWFAGVFPTYDLADGSPPVHGKYAFSLQYNNVTWYEK